MNFKWKGAIDKFDVIKPKESFDALRKVLKRQETSTNL